MHRTHGRASAGRVRRFGSGPSLRLDGPEGWRMWACAAASAVRARRLPARWYGEPEDATVAGAETREVSWAAHLGEEMDTPLPRLTRASVRWAPPGLGVEAAAPFGGVLVPASGVRLLAAAERTLEGAR